MSDTPPQGLADYWKSGSDDKARVRDVCDAMESNEAWKQVREAELEGEIRHAKRGKVKKCGFVDLSFS